MDTFFHFLQGQPFICSVRRARRGYDPRPARDSRHFARVSRLYHLRRPAGQYRVVHEHGRRAGSPRCRQDDLLQHLHLRAGRQDRPAVLRRPEAGRLAHGRDWRHRCGAGARNQLRLRVALRSAAGCRRWTAGRLEQLLGHVRHGLVGALVQRLSPTAGRAGGERRRHALGRVRVVLRRDAGAVCPLHEGPAEAGGLRRPEGRARLRSGDARRTHGAAPRYRRSCRRDRRGDRGARLPRPRERHGGQDHRRRREGRTRRGHRARAPRDRLDRARRNHGVGRGRRGRDQRAGGQAGARQGGAGSGTAGCGSPRAETAAHGRRGHRPRRGRRAIGARSARPRAVSECRLPCRHRTAGRCGDHAREGRRDSCDGYRSSASTTWDLEWAKWCERGIPRMC